VLLKTISETKSAVLQGSPSNTNPFVLIGHLWPCLIPFHKVYRIIDEKPQQFTELRHEASDARRAKDYERTRIRYLST
jgi:hypothetical protein